jgi:hypothetical protein
LTIEGELVGQGIDFENLNSESCDQAVPKSEVRRASIVKKRQTPKIDVGLAAWRGFILSVFGVAGKSGWIVI